MFARLSSLTLGCFLVLSLEGSTSAQEARRTTAQWGSMPNGWAGYSLMQGGGFYRQQPNQGYRYGGQSFRLNNNAGNHGYGDRGRHYDGGYSHHYRGGGNRGYGYRYPGYGYPIYGYGYPGYGGFGYGYPYGYGNYYSGLSLSVVAPPVVVVQPQGVAVPVARPAIAAPAANRAANPNANGLGWLDRLEQQQADAFGAREAVAAENREEAFRQRVEVLTDNQLDGRDRADQLMVQADRMFADGDYDRARQRYELALRQADDYPQVLLRLGQVSISLRDYGRALDYYLQGLGDGTELSSDLISLNELYGENEVAKLNDLQRVTEAAFQSDGDGRLTMLVGLMLYFDGQLERASGYFRKAATQPGVHVEYAKMLGDRL